MKNLFLLCFFVIGQISIFGQVFPITWSHLDLTPMPQPIEIAPLNFQQNNTYIYKGDNHTQTEKLKAMSVSFKLEGYEWTTPKALVPPVDIVANDTYLLIMTDPLQQYTPTSKSIEGMEGNVYQMAASYNDIKNKQCKIRFMLYESGQIQIYIDYANATICYDVYFINE